MPCAEFCRCTTSVVPSCFEGSVFGFTRPDELGIEMGIVFVGFARGDGRVGLRSDETDGRIVDAVLAFVVVLFDGTFVRRSRGMLRRLVLISP